MTLLSTPQIFAALVNSGKLIAIPITSKPTFIPKGTTYTSSFISPFHTSPASKAV